MSHRSERGALAVWTAVGLLAFMLALGIGVDFSGHTRTVQELHGIAREAARTGTQEADVVVDAPTLHASAAVRAARAYLRDGGHDGTVRGLGPTRIQITLRKDYECRFLSVIGIRTLRAEVTETSEMQPAFSADGP